MKYLISEEELKRIYLRGVYDGEQSESDFKNATVAFLKSKQPVEVIAEGRVDTYIDSLPDNGIGFINNKDIADKLYTHNGNKVKIYLEGEQ